MVETEETSQMTKRAKWAKIKKELQNLPTKTPEIIAIAVDTSKEAITIVTEPISTSMQLTLYDIGRNLRYKYGIPFEHFEIDNVARLAAGCSWKMFIMPEFKIIYERSWDGVTC